MIIDFTVNNYLGIGNEGNISFVPHKDDIKTNKNILITDYLTVLIGIKT